MVASQSTSEHLSEERRAEYVDGRLEPGTRQEVEQHLGGCATCRRDVEQDLAVVTLLRRLPDIDPPRSFALREQGLRSGWARAAAFTRVASGLAAVFLVVLLGADLLAPAPALAPAGSRTQATTASQPAPTVAAQATARSAAAPAAPQAPAFQSAPPSDASAAGQAAPPAAKPAAAAPRPATQALERAAAQPQAEAAAGSQRQADAAEAPDSETTTLKAMGTPAPLPLTEVERTESTWGLRQWQLALGALALALAATAFILGRRARAEH